MRKIRNSMFIFIFILLIGFNVKAESFNYYLSTNDLNYEYVNSSSSKVKSIKRGDTIIVTAIIDNKDNVTNYRLNSGKLTIRWDDKFVSLQEVNGKYYNESVSDIEGLTIGSVNKGSNRYTISELSSTGTLKAGKNKIVEFKFLVLQNSSSGETKIYQQDTEDSLKCYNVTEEKSVNCGESLLSELKYNVEKSKINKLSNVKINGTELDYFDENKNDYEITVESDVAKVNIEVTKKDSKSTISGNYGENTVDYGENKFIVNVISESGDRNVYNFKIIRNDSRSSINTLKTLTISSGELKFDPNVTSYDINVENEINKVTITSSLADSKSKYVTDYQNKEIELIEGSNKVEIKVVSEKGDERVYTLNITRSLSSNNSLKSLKINDEKIKLEEGVFTYNLDYENDIEEVIIKAEPNDPKATVELDEKYPLQAGENEINIIVTAASGQKASYIVNITRAKLLSKDSLLTSIKIKGYDIGFKQNTTLYNLKIKDEDNELEITTTQEDPNATVEIEGNKDLENGSIIKINVKAEDGSFTRYFINIEKGSEGISPIIIIIIVLFVILCACVGIIFYRKKKKEKKEFDKIDEAKEEAKEENKQEEQDETTSLETEQSEEMDKESLDNIVGEVNKSDNETVETSELNYEFERGKHEEIGKHEPHEENNEFDDIMSEKKESNVEEKGVE